jgi:hypothetical protein
MPLKATVSGSFHRHMPAVYSAVGELRALGVDVLSPADPRVVDFIGEFLFVASDQLRSIKLVEDRHLEAIRASDFLWVVCPDGYTGPSTSGEILAASVLKVPVFSDSPPMDITIGQYVRRVPSFRAAVEAATIERRPRSSVAHVLLDPDGAILRSMDALDHLRPVLTGREGDLKGVPEQRLKWARDIVGRTFGFISRN